MVQLHRFIQLTTSKRKWGKYRFNLKTPLHFTLMLNHEEFVISLLQNGVIFYAKDQDKINPIEEGSKGKQMTTFKTILSYNQF